VKDPSGAVIARAQVTLYSDGQLAQITNRWSVTFSGREELLVTVQGRVASNEYDDDQNQLPLGGNFVLSATVSHPLPRDLPSLSRVKI
jgi:hypothetical protein